MPVAEAPPRSAEVIASTARNVDRLNSGAVVAGTGRPAPPARPWEVRTDAASTVSPSRKNDQADLSSGTVADGFEGLETAADEVDDGHVSADGFNPDLLKADRASQSKKGTRAAVDLPQELPADRRAGTVAEKGARSGRGTMAAAELAENAETIAQSLAEQTGWQDAARRLKKLGIRKYRLESRIDEQNFVFTCTFASPDNPRVVRRFEADADNPLEAVQQVLEQIDEWRNRDGAAGETALLPNDEN